VVRKLTCTDHLSRSENPLKRSEIYFEFPAIIDQHRLASSSLGEEKGSSSENIAAVQTRGPPHRSIPLHLSTFSPPHIAY
jgi:hypothetical protein